MTNEKVLIDINAIVMDDSIQCRASQNDKVVSDYAERMGAGDKFPAVDLFGTTEECWIGDGWHRIRAALKKGETIIEAHLHPGGRTDALKHAMKANDNHGLRRTNADKRKAVKAGLNNLSDLSNRQIADECRVSEGLVRKIKGEVRTVRTSTKRDGKDGKSYPASHRKAEQQEPEGISGVDDEDAGTPADCADEQAPPVSPEKPVKDGEAQPTVEEKVSESSDGCISTATAAEAEQEATALDGPTLSACRGLLDRVSAQSAAEAVDHLRGRIEKESENSESLSEPYSVVTIIPQDTSASRPILTETAGPSVTHWQGIRKAT